MRSISLRMKLIWLVPFGLCPFLPGLRIGRVFSRRRTSSPFSWSLSFGVSDMAYRINPALHRRSEEAAIIGRIVVAFGELEYLTVSCAVRAINNGNRVLKALYSLRSTSGRIDAADALIHPTFAGGELEGDYNNMFAAIRYCARIRNQYAHCNWGDADGSGAGLFFCDLEESPEDQKGLILHWYQVDVPLLEAQEAYFVHALDYLYFFETQLSVIAQDRPIYPAHPKPSELARPPLHNPPELHVPPWLDADRAALHLAHVQAMKGLVQRPTPAFLAQQKRREEKKALQQAQRESAKARSAEPH